jgi:hypothetical protein
MPTRRDLLKLAYLHSTLVLPAIFVAPRAKCSVGNHQAYVDAGNSFAPFWELGARPEFRCVGVIGREKAPRSGGSCVLISPQHILTSAHVFVSNETGQIIEGTRFVTLLDANGKSNIYRTNRVFVPQGYLDLARDRSAWKGPMDVAVAELDRPVQAVGVVPASLSLIHI